MPHKLTMNAGHGLEKHGIIQYTIEYTPKTWWRKLLHKVFKIPYPGHQILGLVIAVDETSVTYVEFGSYEHQQYVKHIQNFGEGAIICDPLTKLQLH